MIKQRVLCGCSVGEDEDNRIEKAAKTRCLCARFQFAWDGRTVPTTTSVCGPHVMPCAFRVPVTQRVGLHKWRTPFEVQCAS